MSFLDLRHWNAFPTNAFNHPMRGSRAFVTIISSTATANPRQFRPRRRRRLSVSSSSSSSRRRWVLVPASTCDCASTPANVNGCMTWTWHWTLCDVRCHTLKAPPSRSCQRWTRCCWLATTSCCWRELLTSSGGCSLRRRCWIRVQRPTPWDGRVWSARL